MQGNHPEVLNEIDEKAELTPEIEEKIKTAIKQFEESAPY